MTESNPVAKYQFPGIIKGNGAEKPWITHTSWRHQAYESIRNELRTKGRLLTQETCGTRPSSPLMIIAILCRLYSVLTDIYTYICIRSQSLIFDLRGGPFIRLFALTCDRRVLCHSVSRTAAHRSVIRSVFFCILRNPVCGSATSKYALHATAPIQHAIPVSLVLR